MLLGSPLLYQVASPVITFDKSLESLVKKMFSIMRNSNGIGLAAPQIGHGVQVLVYDLYDDLRTGHIINPQIVSSDGVVDSEEGCLSIPGYFGTVKRKEDLEVVGFNMYGEPISISGNEKLSKCLQHEIDHLNGILFIERLDKEEYQNFLKDFRELSWYTPDLESSLKLSPHL